ncbi:PhzF family phenazine biosynthesis protein [Nonomuraea sp. NPDC050310]|uniref:PhzF family phenazine biosynthesis protein n=1 Tax=unclassified Nonomuraea TaxID=2593643 RepID=UPI0033D66F37
MKRAFRQVDVFTAVPYYGNPLAVVVDGEGLSQEEMQRFARWTNLSETTFLLPPADPEADYLVRIFTPAQELPFAGHPTLGSCQVWLEAGGRPKTEGVVVQECGAGLVRIRREGASLAFAAPPLIRSGELPPELLDEVARALGLGQEDIVAAAWADNGPGWVAVELADAEAVLALRPGYLEQKIGVVGAWPPGSETDYEVRAFFPVDGVMREDPVTGSLNASVAQWLLGRGRAATPYTASQGTVMGRAGRVRVSTDEQGTIWVGGEVVTCVNGEVNL